MLHVSQINLYPIKSCRGYSAERADLESRGLAGDRRYLLVDDQGRFLTQRRHPRMALIRVRPAANGFVVSAPDQPPLELPRELEQGELRRVAIWRDEVEAIVAEPEVNDWFAQAVGLTCELVYTNRPGARPVRRGYGRPGDDLSFADGAPVMMISIESLEALNERLDRKVEMERFRPSLVVSAGAAFAEDDWRRIRVGRAELEVAWPCSRCTVPTVDVETGRMDPRGEPIETLRTFRLTPGGIMFGQNLIPRRLGRLAVGDAIELVGKSGS